MMNTEKAVTGEGEAPRWHRRTPMIGDKIVVRNHICTIIKIHQFGTLDVIAPNDQAYRVSGLYFEPRPATRFVANRIVEAS